MRALLSLLGIALLGLAAAWAITRPVVVNEADIAGIEPDLERGAWVFHASGCASCHTAPESESDPARPVLAGGARFESDFGVFVAPNITPDPNAGIGSWSRSERVSAIRNGTSPGGQHYYPALPYAAYGLAELSDLVSLAAYLETLPADPTPSEPHELAFPYSIRLSVGGWKMLYADRDWVLDAGGDSELERGRYLVEALGHCAECHTPRDSLGGLDLDRWMAGAPNPSGRGRIPNISPAVLDWSDADIAAYLESGFTPDFDVVGGSMASVVRNFAQLTPEDRMAVARYLKAIPGVE